MIRMGLEPRGLVHDVPQRFLANKPSNVIEHHLQMSLRDPWRVACDVRRNDDVLHLIERQIRPPSVVFQDRVSLR